MVSPRFRCQGSLNPGKRSSMAGCITLPASSVSRSIVLAQGPAELRRSRTLRARCASHDSTTSTPNVVLCSSTLQAAHRPAPPPPLAVTVA
eukprot:5142134-Pleurochrysis_carterae.AAC.2